MNIKSTYLSSLIVILFPLFLQSQASRDTYYSVTDVYTTPAIVDGSVIQVAGYYTNPEVDILIQFYGDYLKDRPFAPHTILKLTGVQPPAEAEYGGYILVDGTVTFVDVADPYNPEDTLMAYLDATEVTVINPAPAMPVKPGGIRKVEQKGGSDNREILDGNCDPCKFAFLLSGGVDSANNHAKYWENLVALYKFKVDSLGYCDSNVFVLYFKGDARDGRIPAGRVIKADSARVDSVLNLIASRVAACTAAGTPATFQKMITNHGEEDGDICLLGDDVITPEHLKEEQEDIVDSCCRTIYDEFIECFGGIVVDAVSGMDNKNKTTIYTNSNANDGCGYSPHDAVHPYLQEKINALDSGKSYPDAVVRAKLAYDEYLESLLVEYHNALVWWRSHPERAEQAAQIAQLLTDSTDIANSICKSRNVTIVPFTHYCQWREFVVPPGGQVVVEFEGSPGSCGNVTVYRRDPVTGELIKVKVWNWNHPGSYGYIPGNNQRVINGDFTESTSFWIHNDNDTSRLKVEVMGSVSLPESPSNIFAYPGFSLGGTDNLSVEFTPIPVPFYFIPNIEIIELSLQSIPSILGPGFVEDFGFSFQIDPSNGFWSDMELIINLNTVMNPGILTIQSESSTIPLTQISINTAGEYIVPLGNFTLNGPQGIIHLVSTAGLQIEFDALGFRSRLHTLPPMITAWVGLISQDWADPANWTNGVPGIFHDVIITPGPFQPMIMTNVMIRSMTIMEEAGVSTAPGVNVIVTGN
jgi:hypothetical protein